MLRQLCFFLFLTALLLPAAPVAATANETVGPVTGLPLPRFAAVEKDNVRVRTGPGTEYPIDWVFTRAAMPVQIVAEYENWRKVRDHEGIEGWMHRSMLTGRRSVMVVRQPFIMREQNSFDARAVAKIMPTVAGQLDTCENGWCRVHASGYRGWVHHDYLWGVTLEEVF